MSQAVGSVWAGGCGCLADNGSVNGQWLSGVNSGTGCPAPWHTYGKTTDFVAPGASLTWVFADEHMDSLNDSGFAVECGYTGASGTFIDIPANYHNGAGTFSFADGHSEIKKWLGPTLHNLPSRNGGPATNNLPVTGGNIGLDANDLTWLQQRTSSK